MGNKIFVGNLSWEATEEELNDLFAGSGEVTSVKIVSDKFTGQPKGFAFVEMASDADALKAIEALNGSIATGAGPAEVSTDLAVLAAYAIALLSVATVLLRRSITAHAA